MKKIIGVGVAVLIAGGMLGACATDPVEQYCKDILDHWERTGRISLEAGLKDGPDDPAVFSVYVDLYTAADEGRAEMESTMIRHCGASFA